MTDCVKYGSLISVGFVPTDIACKECGAVSIEISALREIPSPMLKSYSPIKTAAHS